MRFGCDRILPTSAPSAELKARSTAMPKFVIEREIPEVGKLTPEQLQAVSQTSCGVLREMGPQIQWLHSYVTDNKIYCVYIAPDEATVREHAKRGGFPANSVAQVRATIDPTTSE
jgi:hypothetical protein